MMAEAGCNTLIVNNKYGFIDKIRLGAFYAGTKEDVQTLYFNFIKLENKSFNSFCKAWREIMFPSVFMLRRKSAKELVEYSQGLIHYSKSYLFSSDLNVSLFGLYFIYAVYCKQPFRWKPAKLRLTSDELGELSEILKKMNNEGHLDAIAIFKEMHTIGGINYVRSSLETGIERGFVKYFGNVEEDCPVIAKGPPKVLDESVLETLDTLQTLYSNMKKTVFDEKETLFFEDSNIVTMIKGKISELSQDKVDEVDDTDATGKRRKALKKAAFAGSSSKEVGSNSMVTKTRTRTPRNTRELFPEFQFESEDEESNQSLPNNTITDETLPLL